MTDISSSAQDAPLPNADGTPSAPQPALSCTSPSGSAPRGNRTYLFGVALLVLTVLIPFCVSLVNFVVKEPYSTQSLPLLLKFPVAVLLMYGTLLTSLAGPLYSVLWYLGPLLILWRVVSMIWARSLSPPSGYGGIARWAVRGAAGLILFGGAVFVFGLVLAIVLQLLGFISGNSFNTFLTGPVGIGFVKAWVFSTVLFPLAIYWVEVKSAYDSFKKWWAGRVARA